MGSQRVCMTEATGHICMAIICPSCACAQLFLVPHSSFVLCCSRRNLSRCKHCSKGFQIPVKSRCKYGTGCSHRQGVLISGGVWAPGRSRKNHWKQPEGPAQSTPYSTIHQPPVGLGFLISKKGNITTVQPLIETDKIKYSDVFGKRAWQAVDCALKKEISCFCQVACCMTLLLKKGILWLKWCAIFCSGNGEFV